MLGSAEFIVFWRDWVRDQDTFSVRGATTVDGGLTWQRVSLAKGIDDYDFPGGFDLAIGQDGETAMVWSDRTPGQQNYDIQVSLNTVPPQIASSEDEFVPTGQEYRSSARSAMALATARGT